MKIGLIKIPAAKNEQTIQHIAEATAKILLPQIQASAVDVTSLAAQLMLQMKEFIGAAVAEAVDNKIMSVQHTAADAYVKPHSSV